MPHIDTQLVTHILSAIRAGRYSGVSRGKFDAIVAHAYGLEGEPLAARLLSLAHDYKRGSASRHDAEGYEPVCHALADLCDLVRAAREVRS